MQSYQSDRRPSPTCFSPARKLSGASVASASTVASQGGETVHRVHNQLGELLAGVIGQPRELTMEQAAFVASLGLPKGLAQELLDSHAQFPIRLWVLDNSGSMGTRDGHRAVGEKFVPCSRWEELGASLEWHARVSAELQAASEFHVLNGHQGPVRVGFGGRPTPEVAAVRALCAAEPQGRTPLCGKVREATRRIAEVAPQLRAAGQRAVLVIASDGAATDGDVAQAMRPLRDLPVWVVVRLCTDDDKVLEYWNNIDEELELDMDVLDDLRGEAQEVHEHNRWLTYAPALHLVRERGAQSKLFDLIDEKALTLNEVQAFAQLVFGAPLPHPEIDWAGFEAALAKENAATPLVFDPLKNRQREWIVAKKVRKLRSRNNSCAVM